MVLTCDVCCEKSSIDNKVLVCKLCRTTVHPTCWGHPDNYTYPQPGQWTCEICLGTAQTPLQQNTNTALKNIQEQLAAIPSIQSELSSINSQMKTLTDKVQQLDQLTTDVHNLAERVEQLEAGSSNDNENRRILKLEQDKLMCDVVLFNIPGEAKESPSTTVQLAQSVLRAAGFENDIAIKKAKRRVYSRANSSIVATLDTEESARKLIKRLGDKSQPMMTHTTLPNNTTTNTQNTPITAGKNLAPQLLELKTACTPVTKKYNYTLRVNIHNCSIYLKNKEGKEKCINSKKQLREYAAELELKENVRNGDEGKGDVNTNNEPQKVNNLEVNNKRRELESSPSGTQNDPKKPNQQTTPQKHV